jgi:subtilisin-like proprotein convertase family protein
MTKKYPFLLIFLMLILTCSTFAQDRNPWSRLDVTKVQNSEIQTKVRLERYSAFALDRSLLERDLGNVPSRRDLTRTTGMLMKFPDKNGRMISFRVSEAPVMSAELTEKYPNNRSYVGLAVDGSQKKIRFSMNEIGFNAVVVGPDLEVQYIEPLTRDKTKYRVYDRSELQIPERFQCLVDEVSIEERTGDANRKDDFEKSVDDLTLRTFQLAVATTGEYSQFHIDRQGAGSGTEAQQKAVVLAAITTAITRINAVYENDLAITLQLIDNNEDIIYLDPDTDPYTNDDGSEMLGQNQNNLDAVIGSANYDIGHVFSTGGGGIASLAGSCNPRLKARGVTGLFSPVGEYFYFDFVAHELGHQLGANHTFNGDSGTCAQNGQRNEETAVEPGSGSTLMAYAGLCSPQNIQGQSDLYFHTVSIDEIMKHIREGTGTCAELSNLSGNRNVPVVSAGPDFTIPIGTPYVLRGTASDGDNDPLSYCWEQIDNEITAVPPEGTSLGGALYRSLPPTAEPDRYLPSLSTLLQGNISSTWEVTPLVSRSINFRLTARANNAEAGQVDSDDLLVTVTDAAGPFVVTSQATEGLAWTPNTEETISWNVAGTTGNGVNVSRVNIRLSTDGGKTFPLLLASNVQNDGSETVTVPDTPASKCFVMVEAVGNFFFSLNEKTFSIGEFNEVCSETSATDTPITIPEVPATITSSIEITDDVTVEALRVKINNLEHTWLSDLDISIESPSGTVVELLSGECDDADDIVNAIFDDSGDQVVCAPSPGITGVIKPLEALASFSGESAQGIWTLKIIDRQPADGGRLVDWSLEVCTSEPVLSVNNYVFDNFKIFPNPSSGRFRIQFEDETSADIELTLFDLLGRKVALRRFPGLNLSFDEEVSFNGLTSGLYILRVKKGNRISSQKISIE